MDNLLDFYRQVARLKELPRAGWVRRGLDASGVESVAEHSFLAAVIALTLADDLGVDAGALLRLVLVHDLPECDPAVGDITPFCGVSPEEKRSRERAAMARLCDGLPGGPRLFALWEEYDAAVTPESALAHEIDALEMAVQSRRYEDRHGLDLAEFRASARAKVRHPALLRLLDALEGQGP
jgi:putative hydrolase of HD superfamily